MMFIVCFIFTILYTVECQDYIFKTIDSLEERLSALESNRNACPACSDCADINTKYNDLKVEMGQVTNTVNNLKLELNRLQASETKSTQISTPSGSQNGKDPQTSKLIVASSTVQHNSTPSRMIFNTSQPTVSISPVTFPGTTMGTVLPVTSTIASTSTETLSTTTKTTSPTTSSKTMSTTTKTTSQNTSSAISATAFTLRAGPHHDCKDFGRNGHHRSGLYDLSLPNGKQITAYCDLQNDGGGWIVIQRRVDGKQSFNQNWNQYKAGFGNPLHEFWIGNENLHALTNGKDVILHIKMMTWDGKNYTAVYSGFHVGSEQEKYKLKIQQMISGDAGDSFKYPSSYMLRHNNMAFSTPDHDNDVSFQNCAKLLQSGWWFNQCYSSNLNGVYLTGPYGHRTYGESFGQPTTEGTGIEWYPLKQKQYSLRYVEMKIRAK